jgi:glyceraldehyde-3-phosphate dehydrogenase/erythrose-4-phosphate dehydrogenase
LLILQNLTDHVRIKEAKMLTIKRAVQEEENQTKKRNVWLRTRDYKRSSVETKL